MCWIVDLGSWIFCVGICAYIHAYIHASWILDLLCWILFAFFHCIFECSVAVAILVIKQSNSGIQSTDCLPPSSDCTMALVSKPIAVAAERCNTKLVADPAVTIMDLYQSLDRFLSSRNTNDLVLLLSCMEGVGENDSPTKFGRVFVELKDLMVDLIQWAPNCVLPRNRLVRALTKLNDDRRWHFGSSTLSDAAHRVRKQIRLMFTKLRQMAQVSAAFKRFVEKASPSEFEAVDELLGKVDLKNTFRGYSQVFQKELAKHDEDGLSLIFDKVLNNRITQLEASQTELPHFDLRCERNTSRTSSMESLQEPNMSRTSSTESLDSMAMDEFEKFPIYCMQSDTVQWLVKTGESCGELGMVTPPRKRSKLDKKSSIGKESDGTTGSCSPQATSAAG